MFRWQIVALSALALFVLTASARTKNEETEPARGDEEPPEDIFDDRLDWYPVMSENEGAKQWPTDLKPSEKLKAWLKNKERLMLERYELGDGGVTIGYGHYEPYSRAHLVPQKITIDEAERLFEQDIESRGAKYVRLYVNVPLFQHEFDALTSLAFNLSPRSFKRIADALNAGENWKAIALEYTRPGTNLERGLIARREKEFDIFDEGVYA